MATVKKEKKPIKGQYVAPAVFLQGTPFSATEQTYDEYMQQAEKFIGKTFPGFTFGLKIPKDKTLADLTKEKLKHSSAFMKIIFHGSTDSGGPIWRRSFTGTSTAATCTTALPV